MSYATVNFSDSEEGLFTPQEIRGLMRVEYDRARRYGYSASVLLIAVDRLEYLHDLYGWESREEILTGVIRALRSTTRDSDFLGCMQDDRIMAVFPHTDAETIEIVAARLLRICRGLDFRSDGRSLKATLSIGLASLRADKDIEFEDFLKDAEEAVLFALSSGGDRYARRESATDVIEDLREEIERESQALEEEQSRLAEEQSRLDEEKSRLAEEKAQAARAPGGMPAGGVLATPGPVPEILDLPEGAMSDRLRETFRRHRSDPDALEEEVLRLVAEGVQSVRAAAMTDHRRQVDQLERRLTKLKELLESTESELVRVATLKGEDTGIASIYRTVQGLEENDQRREQKREMLSLIFQANLDLQKKDGDS